MSSGHVSATLPTTPILIFTCYLGVGAHDAKVRTHGSKDGFMTPRHINVNFDGKMIK